jgi:hypothetical protein
MDFRNIPNRARDRTRFAPRDEPPNTPLRGSSRWCSIALYLLVATIVGLPLAFPSGYYLWLGVDTGLAIATACFIAYTER